MIEVTIFIFEFVIMPSMSSVVWLTYFCAHVIVHTYAVVFVETMQLAVLKISNNFSSYCVVHQTLANEGERSWELKCTTIIWNKKETNEWVRNFGGKKYYLCRVFFPKVPFGVFVLEQGTTYNLILSTAS